MFRLRRLWSTGAASGSGNGGQSGSEVTTLANIYLHPHRGLRVQYCSRSNTALFKCLFFSESNICAKENCYFYQIFGLRNVRSLLDITLLQKKADVRMMTTLTEKKT